MKRANTSAGAMGRHLTPLMPALWRFALSLSGRPDVADDLVQSTCLRAMEKHRQFDGHGNLTAWCMTICRSIWVNQLRSNAIRAAQSLDATREADLASLHPDAETNIFAVEVFTQVMKLPEAQRETVFLVYVEGFRYSEAAKILGVPIGTIMSRLSTARQKLSALNATDQCPSKTKGSS